MTRYSVTESDLKNPFSISIIEFYEILGRNYKTVCFASAGRLCPKNLK